MSIESIFIRYQEVWDDCYFGYVILANEYGKNDLESVRPLISAGNEFNFYPWLKEKEELQIQSGSLREVDLEQYSDLFLNMAREAIAYGSKTRISDEDLIAINREFVDGFNEARYYTNFSASGWRPVTLHSRDSLLCVVGTNKIGMWLSCDDE